MPISRRRLVQLSSAAGAVAFARGAGAADSVAGFESPQLPAPIAALKPMTDGVDPISPDEHKARLRRAQELLASSGLDAIVLGPGTSLTYFTGAKWNLSERFFGAVLTRQGDPAWV